LYPILSANAKAGVAPGIAANLGMLINIDVIIDHQYDAATFAVEQLLSGGSEDNRVPSMGIDWCTYLVT
jgi:hypothetical protein